MLVVDVERLRHAALHLLQMSGAHIFSFFCGLKGMMPNIQETCVLVGLIALPTWCSSTRCSAATGKELGLVGLPLADREE